MNIVSRKMGCLRDFQVDCDLHCTLAFRLRLHNLNMFLPVYLLFYFVCSCFVLSIWKNFIKVNSWKSHKISQHVAIKITTGQEHNWYAFILIMLYGECGSWNSVYCNDGNEPVMVLVTVYQHSLVKRELSIYLFIYIPTGTGGCDL